MDKNKKPSAQIIPFRAKSASSVSMEEFERISRRLAISTLDALTRHAANQSGITAACIQKLICERLGIQDYQHINSQEQYDNIEKFLFDLIDSSEEHRTETQLPKTHTKRQAPQEVVTMSDGDSELDFQTLVNRFGTTMAEALLSNLERFAGIHTDASNSNKEERFQRVMEIEHKMLRTKH